jgi:hypothetical protein
VALLHLNVITHVENNFLAVISARTSAITGHANVSSRFKYPVDAVEKQSLRPVAVKHFASTSVSSNYLAAIFVDCSAIEEPVKRRIRKPPVANIAAKRGRTADISVSNSATLAKPARTSPAKRRF